jgi:hypothetical protein
MQVHKTIAYRLAYETANLELELMQKAMRKMQQQKDQVENCYQLQSDNALPFPGFFPPGAP